MTERCQPAAPGRREGTQAGLPQHPPDLDPILASQCPPPIFVSLLLPVKVAWLIQKTCPSYTTVLPYHPYADFNTPGREGEHLLLQRLRNTAALLCS